MVIETENNMKSRSLRVKHNPLIAFNESKSKLGKLPQLVCCSSLLVTSGSGCWVSRFLRSPVR